MAKKRGNGAAKNPKAPISLTPVQQVQARIETYDQALQERAVSIEAVSYTHLTLPTKRIV